MYQHFHLAWRSESRTGGCGASYRCWLGVFVGRNKGFRFRFVGGASLVKGRRRHLSRLRPCIGLEWGRISSRTDFLRHARFTFFVSRTSWAPFAAGVPLLFLSHAHAENASFEGQLLLRTLLLLRRERTGCFGFDRFVGGFRSGGRVVEDGGQRARGKG